MLLFAVVVFWGSGCASPGPSSTTHTIAPGENLYRIGLLYDVDAAAIASANGIRDVHALRVGQRLTIPSPRRGTRSTRAGGRSPGARAGARSRNAEEYALNTARETAFRQAALQFVWPARGKLSSGFGMRKGKPHEGIDIAGPTGSTIRAAEAGKVITSGRLGGYGKVVVLKHSGDYRSVYAHASKLLVTKGQFVEKGQKIAEVGSTGRSTGPHLHFEIRRDETPQNPMAYLPRIRR